MNALACSLEYPVIGVEDLDRSVAFYERGLGLKREPLLGRRSRLSNEGRTIILEEVGSAGVSGWIPNSQQLGIRHVGLKVDRLEPWVESLRRAGATFTIEPREAFGGVRIAFFLDPDGTLLEIVEGFVDYTTVLDDALLAREREPGLPSAPRVDHVAVTVADLDLALEFYERRFGFVRYGELAEPGESRGLRLNYLWTGAVVLEVFSFDAETLPNHWAPARSVRGLSRLSLSPRPEPASRARVEAAPGAEIIVDLDGTPFELGTNDGGS